MQKLELNRDFSSWFLGLFFVLAFGVVSNAEAQDPVFSQFYLAPTQLNPAFVGNSNGPNFALNYRNQWPGMPNAYTTYAVAYDQFFERYSSGFGLIAMTDNAGDGILTTQKVGLQYSYKARINQSTYLKGGLEIAFVQNNLDWDKLIFFDQLDPEFGSVTPGGSTIPSAEVPPESLSFIYPDISFGLAFYSSTFYGGMVLHHMNSPQNSFFEDSNPLQSGVPLRWTLHGGAQFSRSQTYRPGDGFFSPNLIYTRQASFSQLNIGIHGGISALFGGLAYRHSGSIPDAIILSIGFRTGNMRIGYAFDYTVSDLGISVGGAHELGIQYRIERARNVNYNDCFGLFR
ncbi:MAG: type IX secretion system membrane protein PorP/SprF [Bacteroidetes bacterium]|nr:type IX secretion system membrane protein PorP/SprF [Bacteroidota bacterium]